MFENETGLSQIMIAIDPSKFNNSEPTDEIVNQIVEDVKASQPDAEGKEVLYPGERALRTREENLREGIPVLDEVWEKLK